MLFHAVDQGAAADIQIARGLCLISVELVEGAADQLALDCFQARCPPREGSAKAWPLRSRLEMKSSGKSSSVIRSLEARTTSRSSMFSSCRTLPGQP